MISESSFFPIPKRPGSIPDLLQWCYYTKYQLVTDSLRQLSEFYPGEVPRPVGQNGRGFYATSRKTEVRNAEGIMNSIANSAVATKDGAIAIADKQGFDSNNESRTTRNSAVRYARDHAHTTSIAKNVITQIEALQLPADPPSFELWYNYVIGENQALNQCINEALGRKGQLSVSDVDQIYERYLSPTRFGDAVDGVGSKINKEIGQIAALIRSAISSTIENQRHFADIGQRLKNPIDHASLRSIVENLIQATKTAEEENSELEAKLKASQHEIEKLQSNLNVVRIESVTDPLTQLANRNFFDRALAKAIADAEQRHEVFCLLFCDIDHFKKFNDTFGHLVGDQVLRLVAHMLKQSIKGQDTASRYGGEEFAILLPGTGLSGATCLAEMIRKAVMSKELEKRSTGEKLGRVTISIGVAQFQRDDSCEKLIDRADKCLYAAKETGRNRVVSEFELDVQ